MLIFCYCSSPTISLKQLQDKTHFKTNVRCLKMFKINEQVCSVSEHAEKHEFFQNNFTLPKSHLSTF